MSTSASYKGLRPASARATAAARGASRKADTRCECLLRSRLWRAGCRFTKNVGDLPGNPDIVFSKAKLVVFCDGDFWHGRDWEVRKRKLEKGNNPGYWIRKIERNMERDYGNTELLNLAGWTVVRVWESDILKKTQDVVSLIQEILKDRGHFKARKERSPRERGNQTWKGTGHDAKKKPGGSKKPSAAQVVGS